MATSERMRHPADGLYTFSAKRARELGACSSHVDAWVARHGEREVPVTLADMAEQERSRANGSAVRWCLLRMEVRKLLTHAEAEEAISQWFDACGAVAEARALMDALLARAKREGRVV